MASFTKLLNRLLPFATPGTPFLQDLVHLGVICVLLYFAPQIQERLQQTRLIETDGRLQDLQNDVQRVIEEDAEGGREHDDLDLDGNDVDDARNQHNNGHIHRDEQQDEVLDVQPNGAAEPGPAGNRERVRPQRNVGAKKAKSLARRDQRRAYHEFQRNQGEAQRARDAEGAAEREAQIAAERERRKAAEAKLEEKKAKERERRREAERKEREFEMVRREQAVDLVRRNLDETRMCNVFEVARQFGGDADDVWLQKILNASGLLGKQSDGSLTMITSMGWVVRVRSGDMAQAYARVAAEGRRESNGTISYEVLGKALEVVVKESSAKHG